MGKKYRREQLRYGTYTTLDKKEIDLDALARDSNVNLEGFQGTDVVDWLLRCAARAGSEADFRQRTRRMIESLLIRAQVEKPKKHPLFLFSRELEGEVLDLTTGNEKECAPDFMRLLTLVREREAA